MACLSLLECTILPILKIGLIPYSLNNSQPDYPAYSTKNPAAVKNFDSSQLSISTVHTVLPQRRLFSNNLVEKSSSKPHILSVVPKWKTIEKTHRKVKLKNRTSYSVVPKWKTIGLFLASSIWKFRRWFSQLQPVLDMRPKIPPLATQSLFGQPNNGSQFPLAPLILSFYPVLFLAGKLSTGKRMLIVHATTISILYNHGFPTLQQ